MDEWKSVRVVLRRWPVLVAMAILTSVGIAGALSIVPPTYEARTTLLLSGPAGPQPGPEGVTLGPRNPYLGFDGALMVTANVMSQAMNQVTAGAALKRAGAKADYKVLVDFSGRSPTLTVVASGGDSRQAAITLQKVIQATQEELAHRQDSAGAPKGSRIVADQVTLPETPKVLHGAQVRAIAGVGAVGTALALILVFVAEGRARRRVLVLPTAPPAELVADDAPIELKSRAAR